jgi:pimeloyl-ACP methyl ester carboxylesterase
MLHGAADSVVPIELARKPAEAATKSVPKLTAEEIEGSHFFLLANREATFAAIRNFMKGP